MGLVEDLFMVFLIIILFGLGLLVLFYPLPTLLPEPLHWLVPEFLQHTSILHWFFSTDIQTKVFLIFPTGIILALMVYAFK